MKRQNALNIHHIAEKIYGKQVGEDVLRAKDKNGPKGFYQPLPDMVGLSQHDSECASDCIQETLLFADGLREYTQPILYGLTKEQIELRVQMTLESDDWSSFQDYIYFIQKRFRAHYDVINYLRVNKVDAQKYYDKKDEVCGLNPLFKKKERTSLEAGVLALKHYKKEVEYSGTGLTFKQVKEIVSYFFRCLSIPFVSKEGVEKEALGILMSCYRFTVSDGLIRRNSLGHAISFIKMKGRWVFYDNNEGFTYIDDAIVEALEQKVLRVVIYKKPYFVRENGLRFESAFADGKWDTELVKDLYDDKNVLKKGIYYYDPHSILSILKGPEPSLINDNHRLCGITAADLKPKTSADLLSTMTKFRSCIYSNLSSNSGIFENLFAFASDSVNLVKETPEVVDFLAKTIPGIVLRPALSPMSHYWCYKIGQGLKGASADSLQWFDIPKLKSIYLPSKNVRTPQNFIDKLKEVKKKNEAKRSLTPCPPGQVRNADTKACRDRKKRMPVSKKKNNNNNAVEKKRANTRKSRCPKGEVRNATGACVKRESPCPPGMKRDKETRLCKKRVEECPEGQVRDPKTKKCRAQKAYKF